MSVENMNLKQAAEHVHIDVNELRHAAQRGEIAAVERAGDWFFRHRDLDEWAQRDFLAVGKREQLRRHRTILDEHRRAHDSDWRVWRLFRPGSITLELSAHSRAGVLRDMTDLAVCTELVYDHEALFQELRNREEAGTTAVDGGVAFLHPRFHDPYLFEDTFVAYGRALHPVFFGSADGEPTRHFFLICSTDHELHLHILARLAVMAHSTELLTLLDEAEDADRVIELIGAAEEGLLK